MARSDGCVIINTHLNDKEAVDELDRLTKKIDALNEKISDKKQEQMPLVEQSKQIAANLDAAKAQLDQMRNGDGFYTTGAIKEQEQTVKALQKEWDSVQSQVERMDTSIARDTRSLERMTNRAGDLNIQIMAAKENTNGISLAAQAASKQMDKFFSRIKALARRVLVFSLITKALTTLRSYMWSAIKTNDKAVEAVAKLKGALRTLAQPIVNVVVPAFTMLVNVITRVVNAISALVSMIVGTTVEESAKAAESLYEESDALDKTGKSAKKASKSLASFDEINRLSGTENKSDKVAPDFTSNEALSDKEARGILGLITTIGALLLGLRLSDSLISGLQTAVGLALAFQGAIKFISSLLSTWLSGLDWDNFLGMLVGAAALVAGLALAFGKVGAAIGLIITGIAELVAGFRDADINGWNLKNTLLTITGMISSGLGISLLTGSWIPLIIAGILSVALAITVATGHGKELIDGLKTAVSGFKDFFIRVFEGDIPAAIQRLRDAFGGLTEATSAVLDGFRDTFNNLLSLIEYVGNKIGIDLSGIIQVGKNYISNFFGILKEAVSESMNASARILQGLIEFISGTFTQEWETAWVGIKDVLAGILNGIITLFEAVTNLCRNKINSILDMLQELTSFTLPDWLGGHEFGGIDIPRLDKIKIPRLATGAVIPPNREFLAVLGDQTDETNVETPLSTMVQAFKQAITESGGIGGNRTAVLKIGEQEMGRIIFRLNQDQTQRVGIQVT